MQRKLRIYYTSDTHGFFSPIDYATGGSVDSGLANCMSNFQHSGNTLVIDGGDTLQGSPFTYWLYSQHRDGDCVPARLLNLGGYDFLRLAITTSTTARPRSNGFWTRWAQNACAQMLRAYAS